MKERIFILGEIRKCKDSGRKYLINSASELYGACRHKPSFHRYSVTKTSTDEGQISPEKSVSDDENSYSPPNSPCSPRAEEFIPVRREIDSISKSFSERSVNMTGGSYVFSITGERVIY